MTVHEAWERVENWLRSHAPAAYDSLPGPAVPDEIRSTEQVIGRALPREMVDSLSRHNGSGEFVLPNFHRLNDVNMIAVECMEYRRIEDERRMGVETSALPPGGFFYWNPLWTPFAHDESGNSLFLGQARDDSLGRVGVHEKDGGGSFPEHRALTSFTALLEFTARGLHDGIIDLWGEQEAYVDDDGFLEWREAGADDEVAWNMEAMGRRFGFD
ncbi:MULTISPECIES: SMI1/KNR4 family protein [Streptomyces]|uniref:SMI1/KNR4 family protein n=1 Tax=Streptomyces TaxID=1883 RepID=UPI00068B1977|nr:MULTISPECIES: SMI1/KNR4 family protein [Streptomyces]RPK89443.1 hypothetical protein EES46_15575 [Streptomyces sp. ADI98-10]